MSSTCSMKAARSLDERVIAAALDVLASVSETRLQLAMSGKQQADALVSAHHFGRLAKLVEERVPGGIKYVREQRLARRAEFDAQRKREREEKGDG